MDILRLHERIESYSIPIDGVASSRRVDFKVEATQQQIDDGNAIAQGFDTLIVASDKATIASDGIEEATITCVELPTNLDYKIYRDGSLHLSGSVGDGSIEYSSNTPGDYVFEIIDPNPENFKTGYVQLEVV